MSCSICDSTKETRHHALYCWGSEGVELCHDCEMTVVRLLRDMRCATVRSRKEFSRRKEEQRRIGMCWKCVNRIVEDDDETLVRSDGKAIVAHRIVGCSEMPKDQFDGGRTCPLIRDAEVERLPVPNRNGDAFGPSVIEGAIRDLKMVGTHKVVLEHRKGRAFAAIEREQDDKATLVEGGQPIED